MLDYRLLPEHIRDGMKMYVEHGIMPGDFLMAVLRNQLVEAFGRADSTNLARMEDIASFMYNEMPLNAWGSDENIKSWIAWVKEQRDAEDVVA